MTQEQWRKLQDWLTDISQSEKAQNAGWISVGQCEYVLRAFISLVEERATQPRQWSNLEPMSEGERVFVSFRELKRELLG